MKTLKCIDYQQGKILVDEQAEIKKGDLILVNNEILTAGGLADTYGDDHRKIIAQTSNLNLEEGAFSMGYKAAQPKKYTEDDLRKAIAEARMSGQGLSKLTDNEIIKSLQPKIESVEVETTQENLGEVFNGRSSHIMWGDIKPITYQKDGKTYLKINKINYEHRN
jgi:hypothetical protein